MSSINLTTYATAAAQFLGVLDSGESLSAQQLTDALPLANQLLESWYNAQVIAINAQIAIFKLSAGTYTPATIPQFADTTTPLTLPQGYDRALALGLAIEMGPYFSITPPPIVQQNFLDAIAAASPPGVAEIKAGQAKG